MHGWRTDSQWIRSVVAKEMEAAGTCADMMNTSNRSEPAYQRNRNPALMVDLDIMEANMDKMMQFLEHSGAGVGIRPHAKTHKTPEIAMTQMERGALGICCAKLGEAEALAEGGVPDILIANQIVGERKIRRLVALSKKPGLDLKVAVDTRENLEDISSEAARQGGRVGIVVEVEVGLRRGGVRTVEEAVGYNWRHLQIW